MSEISAKRKAEDAVLPYAKRPYLEACQQGEVDVMCEFGDTSSRATTRGEICHECRKLNFERLLNLAIINPWFDKARRYKGLSFSLPHINKKGDCPLCKFLCSVKVPPRHASDINPIYQLYVFIVQREFGTPKNQVHNSPAFVVLPPKYKDGYSEPSHAEPRHGAVSGIFMELTDTQNAYSGRQLRPQVDFSDIKNWIDFCGCMHKTLCKPSESELPRGFRVIDCSTRNIVLWDDIISPKLHVTLSYVWGGVQDEGSISECKLMYPLPKTIEDAITTTTKLGYRYLWIDRYCIPQGQDQEKHTQIRSMNVIYNSSVITIIAAAGDNPYYGLPGVSTTPRNPQPYIKIGTRTVIYTPYVLREIVDSTWNSRGWTYQEGLLSPRKLVFTDVQAYFQCNGMHCLESIRVPLEGLHTLKNGRMRDSVSISRVFPHRGLGKYPSNLESRINDYLKRSLAFDGDALDAFRGILTHYRCAFAKPIESICGIPLFAIRDSRYHLDNLVHGLSWRALSSRSEDIKRRPEFPSWTWVGWKNLRIEILLNQYPLSNNMMLRLNALADVNFKTAAGSLLSWKNQESDQVLHHSVSSPLILHIRGLTINVRISEYGGISKSEDQSQLLETL